MAAFRGALGFLSNFHPAEVTAFGVTYPTVEHAYVAAKCARKEDRAKILACERPGDAKRLGRSVLLRHNWDQVKLQVMESLLRRKFAHAHLREKLAAVVGPIIERNQWHDNYWGSCTCVRCGDQGANHLGKLLEKIREEI